MNIIKLIVKNYRRELSWYRHKKVLNSISTMEEFLEYVKKVQPNDFLHYQSLSSEKRLDFQSVLDEMKIEVNNKSILDVGPAFGDSLDVCSEKGSKKIEFIEMDPFFYTYNRLKGFRGYLINAMTGLHSLYPNKYDLIWIKGGISVYRFISLGSRIKYPSFSMEKWLDQLEKLGSPTCKIIICPFWLYKNNTNFVDIRNNRFTDTMLSKGYIILPTIENHNQTPMYPITFYKDLIGNV